MSTKLGVHKRRQCKREVDAVVRGKRLECGVSGHLLAELSVASVAPQVGQTVKCHGCGAINRVGPQCKVIIPANH